MLRDDDLIDDDFQGNAYGPFRMQRGKRTSAVTQPGYAFYAFLAPVLLAILAGSALAQSHVASLVFKVAACVSVASLLGAVIRGTKRGGNFLKALMLILGVSAYIALVAGIATLYRGYVR